MTQRQYVCGHSGCGNQVASVLGWFYNRPGTNSPEACVYICPMCHYPTLFDQSTQSVVQIPGISFGRAIEHLPDDVQKLYEEIRKATSSQSYTAAVLACRKLLMHIAVEKGAEKGKAFSYYVQYLADNHYAPPDSQTWVDKIRNTGNEANHEIKIMTKGDAEELVNFIGMLLTFIYEFPGKTKAPAATAPATQA